MTTSDLLRRTFTVTSSSSSSSSKLDRLRMGELTQPELYQTQSTPSELWQSLWDWLAFFFQIFLRLLRGFSHHSLLSSRSFKPLPLVELPEHDASPPQTATSAVEDDSPDSSVVDLSSGVDRIERLTVVLDLDETLVCAYETSSLPASIRDHAIESGLKWFEMDYVSSEKAREGVTVFERPGLQEFLKQLSEFADLVLFTAGLEGYARPLVDRIDVENLFCLRLYRPSTIKTEHREHVKDLSCLSKDLCRTVIVDNNPFSFLLQPTNGIPCIPFSAGQPNDDQLLTVLLPLLKDLSQQRDVRSVLYEKFHMPEWFRRHGISAPVSA